VSIINGSNANDKWCPFARVAFYMRGDLPKESEPINVIGQAVNRIVCDDPAILDQIDTLLDQTKATRCIGARCAVWEQRGAGGHCGMRRRM